MLHAALDSFLAAYNQETTIEEYDSGRALLDALRDTKHGPDLLFLDIFMEGLTGVETARQMREQGYRTQIIFLTNSPDFAEESYDVEASAYLLKPLRLDKLHKTLERIIGPSNRKCVSVRCGHAKPERIYTDNITYVESAAYRLRVHLADQRVLETRDKLSSFEERMDDKRFLRCHQSYLVNMDYIVDDKGEFVLRDGTHIPIRVRTRKGDIEKYRRYYLSKF